MIRHSKTAAGVTALAPALAVAFMLEASAQTTALPQDGNVLGCGPDSVDKYCVPALPWPCIPSATRPCAVAPSLGGYPLSYDLTRDITAFTRVAPHPYTGLENSGVDAGALLRLMQENDGQGTKGFGLGGYQFSCSPTDQLTQFECVGAPDWPCLFDEDDPCDVVELEIDARRFDLSLSGTTAAAAYINEAILNAVTALAGDEAKEPADGDPGSCVFDINASPLKACRAHVVAILSRQENFANGTGVLIHPNFVLTARHVLKERSLAPVVDDVLPDPSMWREDLKIGVGPDYHSGAPSRSLVRDVKLTVFHPDETVDLALMYLEEPFEPGYARRLLAPQGVSALSSTPTYHVTGFGKFESLNGNTCSSKALAGFQKLGVKSSHRCLAENACFTPQNFGMINPRNADIVSHTCGGDSGGSATVEMETYTDAGGAEHGRIAIRGIVLSKEMELRQCGPASIALDLAQQDIQDWLVGKIAAITEQPPADVRAQIVHGGRPAVVDYADAISGLLDVDAATNDCQI